MSFSFPFWLVLIPYGLVVLFVAVMASLAMHHLNNYGASRLISTFSSFAYILGTAVILLATAQMLLGTAWTDPVSFTPTVGGMAPSFTNGNVLGL